MNSTFRLIAPISLALISLGLISQPAAAQPTFSDCASNAIASGDTAMANINALGRARNLARQTAEATNGDCPNIVPMLRCMADYRMQYVSITATAVGHLPSKVALRALQRQPWKQW